MRRAILVLLIFFVAASSWGQPTRRYEYLKHKVEQGESLSSILKIYNIPLSVFMIDNPEVQEKNYTPRSGDELFVRKSSIGGATTAEIDKEIKQYIHERSAAALESMAPLPLSKNEAAESDRVEHMVQPRETLYSLSKRYGFAIEDILTLNPSVAERGLRVGDKLTILLRPSFVRDSLPAEVPRVTFRKSKPGESITAALLLPLSNVTNSEKQGFSALYKGALIALDSLKRAGVSVRLDVHDSGKSPAAIDSLFRTGILNNVDIIFGPVYNESFGMAAYHASFSRTPIVSPLMEVTSNSGMVIQLAPQAASRYDKLRYLLKDKKIVYYTSPSDDKDFIRHVSLSLRGENSNSSTVAYSKAQTAASLVSHLDTKGETVFIVAASDLVDAELLLSKITALSNSYPSSSISVLGSPAFSRFDDVKKSELFKTQAQYVAAYHADRLDDRTLRFETAYINTFNERPTYMSYRGYDMIMMMIPTLRDSDGEIFEALNEESFTPLQVTYTFFRPAENGKMVNEEWPLVIYRADHTIKVE